MYGLRSTVSHLGIFYLTLLLRYLLLSQSNLYSLKTYDIGNCTNLPVLLKIVFCVSGENKLLTYSCGKGSHSQGSVLNILLRTTVHILYHNFFIFLAPVTFSSDSISIQFYYVNVYPGSNNSTKRGGGIIFLLSFFVATNIQRSKRHRIPDPDPQHCPESSILITSRIRIRSTVSSKSDS
jgi:hypothetical protein